MSKNTKPVDTKKVIEDEKKENGSVDKAADTKAAKAKSAQVRTEKTEVQDSQVFTPSQDYTQADAIDDQNSATTEDHKEEGKELMDELNITKRVDKDTGKVIIPSTPAMRLLKERQQKARQNKTQVTQETIQEKLVEKYGEDVLEHPQVKYTVNTMSEYCSKMGDGYTVTPETGAKMQEKLAQLYNTVLAEKSEISLACLNIIVDIMRDNLHSAFKKESAYRFINIVKLNHSQSMRFQMLTTLFTVIASGVQKKDLSKHVNVRTLLDQIASRDAKSNLTEFLN